MSITLDETGLCAEDCTCPRCEAGYRPTAQERAVARRALKLRRAAAAAIVLAPYSPHRLDGPTPPPPPAQAELAAIAEDIAQFRRRYSCPK